MRSVNQWVVERNTKLEIKARPSEGAAVFVGILNHYVGTTPITEDVWTSEELEGGVEVSLVSGFGYRVIFRSAPIEDDGEYFDIEISFDDQDWSKRVELPRAEGPGISRYFDFFLRPTR